MAPKRGWIWERLAEWRERRHAGKVCDEALAAYNNVLAADPDLKGERLYESVVCRRTGCDPHRAHELVRRAAESSAQWPVERDLKFRDVVAYMIVSEYLGTPRIVPGMRIDVYKFIQSRVPEAL